MDMPNRVPIPVSLEAQDLLINESHPELLLDCNRETLLKTAVARLLIAMLSETVNTALRKTTIHEGGHYSSAAREKAALWLLSDEDGDGVHFTFKQVYTFLGFDPTRLRNAVRQDVRLSHVVQKNRVSRGRS